MDIFSALVSGMGTAINGLSLRNTLTRQDPRLRVTPLIAHTLPDGELGVSIEVVNLSPFPLTISELGLNRRDRRCYSSCWLPMLNGRPLPQRLEARESLTAFFPASDIDIKQATTAFARTACGIVSEGDSQAWQQLTHRD